MKIVVDRQRCVGNGVCESMAPKFFEVGSDGFLTILGASPDEADLADIFYAVGSCPARAIKAEGEQGEW